MRIRLPRSAEPRTTASTGVEPSSLELEIGALRALLAKPAVAAGAAAAARAEGSSDRIATAAPGPATADAAGVEGSPSPTARPRVDLP